MYLMTQDMFVTASILIFKSSGCLKLHASVLHANAKVISLVFPPLLVPILAIPFSTVISTYSRSFGLLRIAFSDAFSDIF